jgi:hypothetical protein
MTLTAPVPFSVAGTVPAVSDDELLVAHDELWKQRALVLREWRAMLQRRERTVLQREQHKVAREAALRRASGGLNARQREWARRHGLEPVSGTRRRAQRHLVVSWAYRRQRVEETERHWASMLASDESAIQQATAALAETTQRLLGTWGKDAPIAAGRTIRQLRALARPPLTSGSDR